VNAIYHESCAWATRPIVYQGEETCPELVALIRSFDAIQHEVMAQQEALQSAPQYHEADPIQRRISQTSDERKWQTVFFNSQGHIFVANCSRFPATSSAISQVPRVFQAFLSRLEPGKSIPPHASPYHAYLRFHLAVEVPQDNPPYLIVGGMRIDWREGEGFLFDDTFTHHVVNESRRSRTVLIVDIERPMSVMGKSTARLISLILRHTHARRVGRNIKTAAWLS
jgi:aspartyl/asparaginyl beta-hydroxylase (cupin superfamily)